MTSLVTTQFSSEHIISSSGGILYSCVCEWVCVCVYVGGWVCMCVGVNIKYVFTVSCRAASRILDQGGANWGNENVGGAKLSELYAY